MEHRSASVPPVGSGDVQQARRAERGDGDEPDDEPRDSAADHREAGRRVRHPRSGGRGPRDQPRRAEQDRQDRQVPGQLDDRRDVARIGRVGVAGRDDLGRVVDGQPGPRAEDGIVRPSTRPSTGSSSTPIRPKIVMVDTAYAVSRCFAPMIGDRARIAELPQIAMPTVMSADSGGTSPSRRASQVPSTSAVTTTMTMADDAGRPRSPAAGRASSRAPSRVIPSRSAYRAASVAPGSSRCADARGRPDRQSEHERERRLETELERRPGRAARPRPRPRRRASPGAPADLRARGAAVRVGPGRAVPIEHVDGVDEADLLGLVGHHQRVGPRAAAEEPHALEQVAGRDAGGGEDEVLARARGPRCV